MVAGRRDQKRLRRSCAMCMKYIIANAALNSATPGNRREHAVAVKVRIGDEDLRSREHQLTNINGKIASDAAGCVRGFFHVVAFSLCSRRKLYFRAMLIRYTSGTTNIQTKSTKCQ